MAGWLGEDRVRDCLEGSRRREVRLLADSRVPTV